VNYLIAATLTSMARQPRLAPVINGV